MVKDSNLIKSGSEAVFAINHDLTIAGWNTEAQQLLGFAANEVIGQRCPDIMQIIHAHGEPLCIPSCEPTRCFRRHQGFSTDSCFAHHKDGEWIPVSVASTVVPGTDGDSDAASLLAVISLNREEQNQKISRDVRTLQVFTFGHFGLVGGGHGLQIENWPRKQALTLLKILVTRLGRVVPSELLCDCLWPEVEERKGRERLKVTVYSLRRELRAVGLSENIIESVGGGYLLRPAAVWVDAETFETALPKVRAISAGKIGTMRCALTVRQGVFTAATTWRRTSTQTGAPRNAIGYTKSILKCSRTRPSATPPVVDLQRLRLFAGTSLLQIRAERAFTVP